MLCNATASCAAQALLAPLFSYLQSEQMQYDLQGKLESAEREGSDKKRQKKKETSEPETGPAFGRTFKNLSGPHRGWYFNSRCFFAQGCCESLCKHMNRCESLWATVNRS
jgi:hypothetical protein